MSSRKFEPKSGNPQKRAEEMRAHRERSADVNSQRQRERSERKRAAQSVLMTPDMWQTTDEPVVETSGWVPRANLDDVKEVQEAGLSKTKRPTVTPKSIERKKKERTRKVAVGFIAAMGLAAMVMTGIQIPAGNPFPSNSETQEGAIPGEERPALIDSNGFPLEPEPVETSAPSPSRLDESVAPSP